MKRSWLKRKSRLKPISDRRKEQNVVYRIISSKVKMAHRGKCCGCGQPGTEVHHIHGREGSEEGLPLLINPLFLCWICRKCHKRLGRTKEDPRGEWIRLELKLLYLRIMGKLPELPGAMKQSWIDIEEAVKSSV